MSAYCDCCSDNIEHIRRHYDSVGFVRPDDPPEDVYTIFAQCDLGDGRRCPLTVGDVETYLKSLKAETS